MKNQLLQLFGILLFCAMTLPGQTGQKTEEKPHDTIIETVSVENIVVPVRVFHQEKLVDGLKKEDFVLSLDGQTIPISGFYQQRKKISAPGAPLATPTSAEPLTQEPRLFVLNFNLHDYHQDLKSLLDSFFNDIIQRGDYLIVISNRFFFPEWKIDDKETTKNNIIALLNKEKAALKSEWQWFLVELRSMAIELKSNIEEEKIRQATSGTNDSRPYIDYFKDFFTTYTMLLEEMQEKYLKLPEERHIKIASYLKTQNRDKWVFNFFQIGQLPLLDTMGPIQKLIYSFLDRGGDFAELLSLQLKNQTVFSKDENILLKDIGKLYIDSGATFHTLLLKPINPGVSEDYRLNSVSSDAEMILKTIAKKTGGTITRSNRLEKFTQKVSASEDIIYVLSYVPDRKSSKKGITITTTHPDYRLEYDNRARVKPFEHALKKMALEKPPVIIEKMTVSAGILTVQCSNITLMQQENEFFGAVQAKIKIETSQNRVFSAFEKTYKGLKAEGIFQVNLPTLPPGKYSIVLEVKDLFSLDNRFVGDAITVTIK